MTTGDKQLTLDLDPEVIRVLGERAYLSGAFKFSGEVPVHQDFNEGDLVTAQIATADGEIVATGTFRVGAVAFVPVKDKELTIGLTRVHAAKLI